jgi:hypothetical protein
MRADEKEENGTAKALPTPSETLVCGGCVKKEISQHIIHPHEMTPM